MLMQMKNTEILSPNLQRATFLGSAIVRSTPQIKDKKQKTKYGAAACKCSGAYKPKTQTNIPDYGCLLDERPAPAQEDTATESRACDNR